MTKASKDKLILGISSTLGTIAIAIVAYYFSVSSVESNRNIDADKSKVETNDSSKNVLAPNNSGIIIPGNNNSVSTTDNLTKIDKSKKNNTNVEVKESINSNVAIGDNNTQSIINYGVIGDNNSNIIIDNSVNGEKWELTSKDKVELYIFMNKMLLDSTLNNPKIEISTLMGNSTSLSMGRQVASYLLQFKQFSKTSIVGEFMQAPSFTGIKILKVKEDKYKGKPVSFKIEIKVGYKPA